MTTNEPTQKWTERNAAALALVDRLPVSDAAIVEVQMNTVCVFATTKDDAKALGRFVSEYAPDSWIEYSKITIDGRQRCAVEFVDGVTLVWFRTVTVRIVEDDQP